MGYCFGLLVMWVASRAVNVNSDNANWCMDYANEGNVNANNNLCNSNGNENDMALCLRPVASIN